jgi:poly-gamma-glutamate synthesis protein (capsule biosynthesis protein)
MAENEWTIASISDPGCNPIDYPRTLLQIQEAKMLGSDFVVVIIHGGHEHYSLPSPRIKAQFRFMIDAGADAVIGHHSHVISGYEVYRNKPIFYSLGNFCFDWPKFRNCNWNKGMALRLIFEKGKMPNFEYDFIHQNDDYVGVRIASDNLRAELEKEIIRLNAVIANDHELAFSFSNYTTSLHDLMMSRIQPYNNRILLALFNRGLFPDIVSDSKKKMLQVLTRCESHREVLLYLLSKKNN